jgi:SAM-dependent MidA family methyltransferase
LHAQIAANGPIPFHDFMAAALYDQEDGYYGSGRAAIGRGGDFFTNVSVGPLFGHLLARQFAEMWARLDRPSEFTIVEQGAHRGQFAGDVLEWLRTMEPDCFSAAHYRIVEPIPALRTVQQTALAGRISWHSSLHELPTFSGVHFSNELLDALPVHLVTWTGSEWLERHVSVEGERFVFVDAPLTSAELQEHLKTIPPVPDGYVTEVNLEALAWIDALATRLARGWVLAIDYGFSREEFYAPERRAGALRAYSAHRLETDVLARPGELDLTTHVEFTSLVERAAQAGLGLAGWTDQHHFMVGLGQLHFRDDAVPEMAELRAYKTLMHPTMMGTSFQALCFAKKVQAIAPLAGFKFARPVSSATGSPPAAD